MVWEPQTLCPDGPDSEGRAGVDARGHGRRKPPGRGPRPLPPVWPSRGADGCGSDSPGNRFRNSPERALGMDTDVGCGEAESMKASLGGRAMARPPPAPLVQRTRPFGIVPGQVTGPAPGPLRVQPVVPAASGKAAGLKGDPGSATQQQLLLPLIHCPAHPPPRTGEPGSGRQAGPTPLPHPTPALRPPLSLPRLRNLRRNPSPG